MSQLSFRSFFVQWLGPVNAYPEYPWRLHALILAPLFAIVVSTCLMHGFWGEGPRLHYEALRFAHDSLTPFFRVISRYADKVLHAIYACIFLYAFWKQEKEGQGFALRYALGSLCFALLLTQLLKGCFGLPRPGNPLPPIPFSMQSAYCSFPSGHTVTIITAALPLALWFRKIWAAVVLSAGIALMGYSRMWLGAHHPVDILAGMAVGSLAARFIAVKRSA